MTLSGNKIIPVLTLILCLLIPSIVVVSAAITQRSGSIWQISIEGYDPRDLLRGHYLRFSYDWAIKEGESCAGRAVCCLCLSEVTGNGNIEPSVRPIDCNAPERKSCDAVIDDGGKMLWAGQQQYFIPEDRAKDLEKMLWDPDRPFHVEVAIPAAGGKPAIRGLYIDGRPMVDVLRDAPPDDAKNPE